MPDINTDQIFADKLKQIQEKIHDTTEFRDTHSCRLSVSIGGVLSATGEVLWRMQSIKQISSCISAETVQEYGSDQ